MGKLEIFGFQALWSPYLLAMLIFITVGYFLTTKKFRHRFRNSEPLTRKQAFKFMTGITLLYVIKGSPIDLMSHLMFYAHMIQMAVLYLVIPPLFITGIPVWIWRIFLSWKGIKPLFTLFTRPIFALILFNGFFSFYHVPLIFDVIKTNIWIHSGYTSLLFLMAIFMWWPQINQLPECQTLNGLKKLGYMFANGILITPACALIIFANHPLYAAYTDPHLWGESLRLCVPSSILSGLNLSGPEMFSSMSLLNDQQLGGVLMKVSQEIVYGIVLARSFFQWYREEQENTEENSVNPPITD